MDQYHFFLNTFDNSENFTDTDSSPYSYRVVVCDIICFEAIVLPGGKNWTVCMAMGGNFPHFC